jgi:ATP-dependent Clp protease adaptor protein ClpS
MKPSSVTNTITRPEIKDEIEVERPRLHKVILVNDDFTPREFVVTVLRAEFRMSEGQALRVMMTAHRRGACVVAVYTKDVAEAKASNANQCGPKLGLSTVVHDRAGRMKPLAIFVSSACTLATGGVPWSIYQSVSSVGPDCK